MSQSPKRYSHVAIVIHWLSAIVILGLLGVGKFMTSLAETDSLRFDLTQWHKSFGLLILALSLFRVIWRLTHKPPPPSDSTPRWEHRAAALTHFVFYLLVLFLPITGWLMVSASPLNISTHLFNLFPVPHLPVVSTAANREELAGLFQTFHEYASGILIVLLILHIAAALRHQFIIRDSLFTRMTPIYQDHGFQDGVRLTLGTLFVLVAGTWLFITANDAADGIDQSGQPQNHSESAAAADENADEFPWMDANVSYAMVVMGDEMLGTFSEARVQVNINTDNLANSTLNAIVETASGSTGSPQIDDSLPGSDWFHSAIFPQASFVSKRLERIARAQIQVHGELKIRDTAREISFLLEHNSSDNTASGGFAINRLDYNIGATEQPDDSHAAFNVLIEFSFPLP